MKSATSFISPWMHIDQFSFKNIISLCPGASKSITKDEYLKLCPSLVQEQVYAWVIASSFVCSWKPPRYGGRHILETELVYNRWIMWLWKWDVGIIWIIAAFGAVFCEQVSIVMWTFLLYNLRSLYTHGWYNNFSISVFSLFFNGHL